MKAGFSELPSLIQDDIAKAVAKATIFPQTRAKALLVMSNAECVRIVLFKTESWFITVSGLQQFANCAARYTPKDR